MFYRASVSHKYFSHYIKQNISLSERDFFTSSMVLPTVPPEMRDSILEALANGALLVDTEGRVISANSAFSRLVGLPRDGLVGMRSEDVVQGIEKHPLHAQYKKVVESQAPVASTFVIRLPKGEMRLLESKAFPVPEGTLFVLSSLSDQSSSDERLITRLQRMSMLFDFIPAYVYLHAADGTIRFANRSFKEMFGEPQGRRCWEVLKGRQRVCENCTSVLAIRSGKCVQNEWSSSDGHTYISFHYPLTDVDGLPLSLIVGVDITAHKKVERALKSDAERLEGLLEDRNRELNAKERLAAIGETALMVGHDLRNPLQSMMNVSFLLNDCLNDIPKQEMRELASASLRRLKRNIVYMDKIVGDLSYYGSPLKPSFTSEDITALLNEVIHDCAVPRYIKLAKHFENVGKIDVDALLAKRLFMNLVSNAVQAMPEGGLLSISASSSGGTTRVEVKDNGVGIPKKIMDQLFSPLITGRPKGMGMGLAVAKKIVDMHSGKISAISTPGAGATFIVELPNNQKNEGAAESPPLNEK